MDINDTNTTYCVRRIRGHRETIIVRNLSTLAEAMEAVALLTHLQHEYEADVDFCVEPE